MPRRILTVGHSYAAGVNRELAEALARVGKGAWDITCLAPQRFRGRGDIRAVEFRPQSAHAVPVHAVPAYLTRIPHAFFYGRQARAILRGGRFDLVHAWEEPYIVAGAQLARWTPRETPFVFRTAQSLPKTYPHPFREFERATIRRAAGWVCSGTLVEANLLARPGYAETPRLRAPLGVNSGRFRPDPQARREIRSSLGWTDAGAPVVGYFGRFVPEKGLAFLQNVLDGLRTPWRALFVGDGPLAPQLKHWAAGRANVRVVTTVAHDEVPGYLSATDIAAVPSLTAPHWKEQFGRAVVEAFAAGVAVIGSDSGEIPHVIRDAGVVAPENDVPAWRAALSALLESPAERCRLAKLARARAETELSWDAVAGLHLPFFERILDERRRDRPAPAASTRSFPAPPQSVFYGWRTGSVSPEGFRR